jgi:hypothetical protein
MWITDVFEQLARDDNVEGVVVERKRLLNIGPRDIDPKLGRVRQRMSVNVDA